MTMIRHWRWDDQRGICQNRVSPQIRWIELISMLLLFCSWTIEWIGPSELQCVIKWSGSNRLIRFCFQFLENVAATIKKYLVVVNWLASSESRRLFNVHVAVDWFIQWPNDVTSLPLRHRSLLSPLWISTPTYSWSNSNEEFKKQLNHSFSIRYHTANNEHKAFRVSICHLFD